MQRQNERDWFGGVSGEKYMGFMVGHKLNLIPIKFIGAARNCWYKPVFLSITRFLSFGCRNTSVLLCARQITAGLLSSVLGTTLMKYTMARKRVQDCKKSTQNSYEERR